MYKGNNEFKQGFQHTAYVIKYDAGKIVADTPSILTTRRWEKFYSNLLNDKVGLLATKEVQHEYTLQPTLLEVELAIENLINH